MNTVTSPKRIERICWVIVLAFGYISARVIGQKMTEQLHQTIIADNRKNFPSPSAGGSGAVG